MTVLHGRNLDITFQDFRNIISIKIYPGESYVILQKFGCGDRELCQQKKQKDTAINLGENIKKKIFLAFGRIMIFHREVTLVYFLKYKYVLIISILSKRLVLYGPGLPILHNMV